MSNQDGVWFWQYFSLLLGSTESQTTQASLPKWLSVRLRTKWLWVRVKLQSPEEVCSIKKGVLENFAKFTGKHLCQSLSLFLIKLLKACNFIKRVTLAQVFSCEFCEIFKNTFLQNSSGRLLLKPHLMCYFRYYIYDARKK